MWPEASLRALLWLNRLMVVLDCTCIEFLIALVLNY